MLTDKDLFFYKALHQIDEGEYVQAFQSLYQCEPLLSTCEPRVVSYYGFCLGMAYNKIDEGIKLCRDALATDSCNAEIYWNLGQLYLMKGDTDSGVRILYRGLRCSHGTSVTRKILDAIKAQVIRRPPAIRWLPRGNRLNIVLGKMTWARSKRIMAAERSLCDKHVRLSDYFFLPVHYYHYQIRVRIGSDFDPRPRIRRQYRQ